MGLDRAGRTERTHTGTPPRGSVDRGHIMNRAHNIWYVFTDPSMY